MLISRKAQIITGLIWVLLVPIIFYMAYTYFPMLDVNWQNIFILFGLMFLTVLLPIQLQNISISFEKWITLTVFLQYGIFVELIFVQLAMVFLLFSQKTSLPLTHKFYVNSLVFGVTSMISGAVYYMVGGEVYIVNFTAVFFYGFIYIITYTLVNNLLLKLYFKTFRQHYSLFSKGAVWDYIASLLIVPFGISFYILSEYLNYQAIFLVGIPFLVVLLAIKKYNSSNNLHEQLAQACEIGHELAKKLLYEEVLRTFLKRLNGVIAFENGYIFDLKNDNTISPILAFENGEITKKIKNIRFVEERVNIAFDKNKTKIYNGDREIKGLKNIYFIQKNETVMIVPVIRERVTRGFLVLTSTRKHAIHSDDIQIVDILASYLAISAEKARFYEQTLNKSERCGLTKLHNYRYFDRKLVEAVEQFEVMPTQGISVVLLDIDYFKKINDAYGHESGNVILIELALLLKGFLREGDVLVRYGGEEFIFILHDCCKEDAVRFAERVRLEIEKTYFTISPDLSNDRQSIAIQITSSLGVASIPEDADSAKSIFRNADRALYIGGKQAGRNQVGVFGHVNKENVLC